MSRSAWLKSVSREEVQGKTERKVRINYRVLNATLRGLNHKPYLKIAQLLKAPD